MQIAAQVFPLLLVLVYLALTIFGITLAVRFVSAHERIARALEETARNQRANPGQRHEG